MEPNWTGLLEDEISFKNKVDDLSSFTPGKLCKCSIYAKEAHAEFPIPNIRTTGYS